MTTFYFPYVSHTTNTLNSHHYLKGILFYVFSYTMPVFKVSSYNHEQVICFIMFFKNPVAITLYIAYNVQHLFLLAQSLPSR